MILKVLKLKIQEKLLDYLITKCAKKNNLFNKNIKPLYDGIYDAREYLGSRIKIMWILKNAYDNFADKDKKIPCGGYYDYNEAMFKDPQRTLCKDKEKNQKDNQSLSRVTYISYGILHEKLWEEMDYISENEEVANSGKEIALINVGKMPGKTTTSLKELESYYHIWKDLILKQIKTYNPSVIIFGGTYNCFKDVFDSNNITELSSLAPTVKLNNYNGERLLIDAYHPGYPYFGKKGEAQYANAIIKGVYSWMPTKK